MPGFELPLEAPREEDPSDEDRAKHEKLAEDVARLREQLDRLLAEKASAEDLTNTANGD